MALRRVIVIYNPIAGRRHRRRFAATLRALGRLGCRVGVRMTAHAGDAERIAAGVSAADCDVLVVAGGDGTINEAVNGLGPDAPPLAVIPLGTANVFARELALPWAPVPLAEIIASGVPVAIRIAAANGRRFVQMAGIGFDARVVEAVHPAVKRRLGRLAYLAEIARQWARHRPTRYQVSVAGETIAASAVIVANGRFYGGPFVVDPDADLTADEFGVCLFLRAGRLPLLRYLLALGSGALARRTDVRRIGARAVEIAGSEGEAVQLDGDIRGTLPCRIAMVAHPLRVLAGGVYSGARSR